MKSKISFKEYIIWTLLIGYFLTSLFYPSLFVVIKGFYSDTGFSLTNFYLLLQSKIILDSIVHSTSIAVMACFLSWLFALSCAFLMERIDANYKSWLEVFLLAPLFLPPFVAVIGLRTYFSYLIPYDSEYNIIVIAFLQALHIYPLLYLIYRSGLNSIPQSLHDSAKTMVSNKYKIFSSIDYGMLKGSVVSSMILVFVASITDVGTPLVFEKRNTIATQIFKTLVESSEYSAGYALTVIILLVSLLAFCLANKYEKKYPASTDSKIVKVPIKPYKIECFMDRVLIGFVWTIALLGIVPHISVLILASSEFWFLSILPQEYTFNNFLTVFNHPLTLGSLIYSSVLSLIATIICLLVGFIIAYRSVRCNKLLDRHFEAVSMLPLAIPGIAIAFGMVVGYAGTLLDNRHNPSYLLVIAYNIRKLPLVVKSLKSAILLIPVGLEEAGRITKASYISIIFKIVIPLCKPAILASAVICFFGALLEVSDSLLIPLEEKYFPIAKALYALQSRPDGSAIAGAYAVILMLLVVTSIYLTSLALQKKISELMKG